MRAWLPLVALIALAAPAHASPRATATLAVMVTVATSCDVSNTSLRCTRPTTAGVTVGEVGSQVEPRRRIVDVPSVQPVEVASAAPGWTRMEVDF